MIKLKPIKTSDTDLYNWVEQLMIESFPSDEYRDLEELRRYTNEKSNFYSNVIFDDDQAVGFINFWKFDAFYYVEHFAMNPKLRNGGLGKRTLEHICKELELPIVLEVERPTEEMAIRRIGFYQRQGFELWENDYIQPPYKAGDDFLPLYLMVHGKLDANAQYEEIKNTLHHHVYGVSL